MAATTYMESGTDATQDLTFYSSTLVTTTGTVTSSTTQSHTSTRSVNLAAGASGGQAQARTAVGSLADAGSRITLWWRVDTTPTSGVLLAPANASAQSCFQIRTNSSSVLTIDTGGGVTIATGTTVLAINTWYRIALSYTITNTTTHSIKVYLNGVLEISEVNGGTILRTGSSLLNIFDYVANNANTYVDDVFIDAGTDLGDPGDIRVTAKRPNANGTTNGYTTQIGVGGSGYGTGHSPQVNERALSTTNGWSMVGAGSAITEEYNIESKTTGDVDLSFTTLVDYMGWLYTSAAIAETGQIILNNVTSNIALTNTNTLFTVAAGSTTYPAGTGTDIGEITSTTVTTVSLYECGILFAYIAYPFGQSLF